MRKHRHHIGWAEAWDGDRHGHRGKAAHRRRRRRKLEAKSRWLEERDGLGD